MVHYQMTTKPKWLLRAYHGGISSQTHVAYSKKEALDIASNFMKDHDKVEVIKYL